MFWSEIASETLRGLRRFLTLLRCPDVKSAALKCLRAGKACSLAAEGAELRTILELGEWKSKALLNYLSLESVDEFRLLKSTLDASDSEGEKPPRKMLCA